MIYQVLKGGDSNIRAIITNPMGNITFARANSQFGWYDEEGSKVPGNEYYLVFSFITYAIFYLICKKALIGYVSRNEQYFTTKIIYIGVLAVHSDLLLEANINAAEEKKNSEDAAIEEFSTTIMVI